MKMRPRRSIILVSAMLALALLIAWWASSPGPNTAAHRATEREAVFAEEPATAASATEPTAKRPANVKVPLRETTTPRDALLASLRSKLEAANVVPREALLTFRSVEARERFARQAATHGLEILDSIPQLNSARVRYSRIEDLRDSLAANPGDFANVEGNLWLSVPGVSPPSADPNNEGGRAPFGYSMLDAINAAGERLQWGRNVTVAVLDTGVLDHPTFAAGQVTRVDLVNDGQAFHSHGTSVASMIGGQHSQAPGVAPAAQILDVRVAGADGYSVGSTLAQGIITAADRGAQIINISLGGYGDSAILGQAVTYATQRGAVVIAAAGNDAYGQLAVPAAYENVISVGSVDAENRQAYFSNAGAGLDLAAPGVGVVSAWQTDKVAIVSGTSQSSALVSAAAATYLSWGVPANGVAARLKADAQPAFNASGVATGVGILKIKQPPGR